MSPVSYSVHAAERAVTTPSPVSTANIYIGATESPSPSSVLKMDPSVPPAMVSPAVVSEAPSGPIKHGITFGTKIGLGMIPVIIFLCATWMFFLLWSRKRRVRKAIRPMGPPPVPQKDHYMSGGSIDSSRRGSKVFNMAAFSTPVHNGRFREAPIVGESRFYDQPGVNTQHDKHQVGTTIAMPEADMDSPVDGKSPFRLKRGDTVHTMRRGSLGTEISSLWPSPPPSAWVKKQPSQGASFSTPQGDSANRGNERI
ncbi:uncharacterized protein K460DRAFT_401219 [Cucurbitaria berberidis CBS 394.84]|uniref:Uncharacterized protein n=1 Tax=Cucurbitaria berberidis CBS 394.84 TaxID=1168544 RepID=A0A9P4GR50_9PLEO|nr:uncharacterized protein K460DRAFT_401219 [Cucurbitaria berberidis CBS 394.84]KAF1851193.1 hypothetical protein K460DRAFT_401219 [Cucurbitaria berberidis CBS 394.84]